MWRITALMVLVWAALAAPPVTARLYETTQQCVARYGTPVIINKNTDVMRFHKNGLIIVVHFHDGQADALAFRKAKGGKNFSDDEIRQLLEANGGQRAWEQRTVLARNTEWHTDDGQLYAQIDNTDNILYIVTREYPTRPKIKLDDF